MSRESKAVFEELVVSVVSDNLDIARVTRSEVDVEVHDRGAIKHAPVARTHRRLAPRGALGKLADGHFGLFALDSACTYGAEDGKNCQLERKWHVDFATS